MEYLYEETDQPRQTQSLGRPRTDFETYMKDYKLPVIEELDKGGLIDYCSNAYILQGRRYGCIGFTEFENNYYLGF